MGKYYCVYDETDGNRILFSGTYDAVEKFASKYGGRTTLDGSSKSFNYKVFDNKCIIIFQGNSQTTPQEAQETQIPHNDTEAQNALLENQLGQMKILRETSGNAFQRIESTTTLQRDTA